MKTLKKQAVFPVLMLLVVTALALIGSSFAWFAMTNASSVTTISSQVEAGSTGLMISADGDHYIYEVTLGAANSADNKTQLSTSYIVPSALHQVSSADGKNFFQANIESKDSNGVVSTITSMADDSIDSTNNLTAAVAELATGKSGYYYVFDLYFSVDEAASLYLDYGSAVADTSSKDSPKAIRVGFISLGNAATSTAVKALSKSNASVIIWEPSATLVESTKVTTNGLTAVNSTPFAAYTSVSGTTNTQTTYTGTEIVAGQAMNSSAPTNAPTNAIASLAAGYNKVRVVIWLEGNDPECVVGIAKATLTIDLKFYALATA